MDILTKSYREFVITIQARIQSGNNVRDFIQDNIINPSDVGTKDPAVSPSSSPTTITTAPTSSSDSFGVIMGNAMLHNLCKHVNGVPKISCPSPLLSCSLCMSAKIRKNGKSVSEFHLIADIRNDLNGRFFQHLFADHGFIVQKSKNMERYKRLCAYNGDNNYLCIECV